MAVLTQPSGGGSRIFDDIDMDQIEPGTYVATCTDVRDKFNVERRKYQSEELERVDLTAFLFCITQEDGTKLQIATKSYKISAHPKSALWAFLKSWLNRDPAYGWDYMEMKGQQALLTIGTEIANNGNEYTRINGISPVPAQLRRPGNATAPKPAAKPPVKPAARPVYDETPFD